MKIITKKEEILEATLKLITEKSSFDITTREIASKAKVNVAAINYYFNTKEQLLLEVEHLFNNNLMDAFGVLDEEGAPKEILSKWFYKVVGYATLYPGMMNLLNEKTIFNNMLNSKHGVSVIEVYLSKAIDLFVKITNIKDIEKARKLFLMLGSSIVLPCMIMKLDVSIGVDFNDKIERIQYIEEVFNHFLIKCEV
ncbi:MAG: TetR family transcriptional regulator [Clostridia bacterium]